MNGVVAVDLGTTSMRAVLFDAAGKIRHIAQRENPPDYFEDGRVEQDPATWRTGVIAILKGCCEAADGLAIVPCCVSVTAQRSSVLPVDAGGASLHPFITWQDSRSGALARAMADANLLVYRSSGLRISPVFSAAKMAWLRRERPDIWNRTHKLLGVQDWVMLQLTGRYATDHTFASRTNLYGLEMRNWDARLLDLFGVPHRMLCDLVAPGAIVGGLTREMASLTGLANGLPVVTAGGDQQCAALGLGLFSPQLAVANIGTGAFVIGHSDKPVFDDAMRVSCNVSAAPGAYIVEAAMLTSGAAHRWVMDLMFPHRSEAMFADFEREAAEAPAGANGVVLLPHFKGSGSPHWDPVSRASFCNLSLSATRADIARALLEGIAFELKEGLELVEALCGPASRVNASGGMTRSELFNRILCDVFESSLRRFWGSEATVQGAWIAGAVATGLASNYSEASTRLCDLHPPTDYRPAAETRDIYRLQRRRARVVYDALASPRVRELF